MSNSERGRFGRISPVALAFLVVALLLGTTGGAVAGALITGSQIKDGTVTSADIKNGSLTAVDIADEPAIYAASKGYVEAQELDDFTADIYTPIVTKSFSTRKGVLFITGYLYTEADSSLGSNGNLEYAIRVDNKIVKSDAELDTSSTTFALNGSITISVPVAAGAHTIALVAKDSANGSYIRERSINAVWSPTGVASGAPYATRPVHPRTGNR